MRIATARQMAAIDRETITAGTAGLTLMERAGAAIVNEITDGDWLAGEPGDPVVVVCGKGNNGGDGLVIARLLALRGEAVSVLLLPAGDDLAGDARTNFERLPRAAHLIAAIPGRWAEQLVELASGARLVVDAVLGTGFVPPLQGELVALCDAFADVGAPVLAVDIPSGVSGDDGRVDPVAVRADVTVTVGLPKLGLLLPPGRDFVGALRIVDIGFDPEVCARHTGGWELPSPSQYLAMLPPRPSFAHKTGVGSLLVLAGSRAYGGAAHLTGLGALRAGVGLLTMAVPGCLEMPIRVGLPEAIVRALPMTASETVAPLAGPVLDDLLARQHALALGPGLGDDPATDRLVVDLLRERDLPVVVDADALNAFARRDVVPAFASSRAVITPHAGELARLAGLDTPEVVARRFTLVPELAARWHVVLLLKGSPTLIATPDGALHVNPIGDDALARGGAGDVLTGVIGSLLAQGATARDAALLGALLHGLAAERAAQVRGRRGLLTREVADEVAGALQDLESAAWQDAALRRRLWPVDGAPPAPEVAP
jgi:ADP-dependent NAD(P)H-hydrate dehydratase / NAD(P)H-hydrate epimerase